MKEYGLNHNMKPSLGEGIEFRLAWGSGSRAGFPCSATLSFNDARV